MPVRLTVRPLALFPLAEGLKVPQDLDGDGFHEDVDGDGVFAETDVAVFARHLSSAVVKANLRAFDFTNDGALDEHDVSALKKILEKCG